MSKLTVVTTTITGDEKAYLYQEVHLQSPGSRGRRRYRRILVNRDGNIAEYKEDMGSAKNFKGVRELLIPAFWLHTVDELRDLADELRAETAIDLHDWLEIDKMKLG